MTMEKQKGKSRKSDKRKTCRICGKSFAARGIKLHMGMKHGKIIESVPPDIKPVVKEVLPVTLFNHTPPKSNLKNEFKPFSNLIPNKTTRPQKKNNQRVPTSLLDQILNATGNSLTLEYPITIDWDTGEITQMIEVNGVYGPI